MVKDSNEHQKLPGVLASVPFPVILGLRCLGAVSQPCTCQNTGSTAEGSQPESEDELHPSGEGFQDRLP